MKNKSFELNLKSEAFNAFKSDFNSILKSTLTTMEDHESEEAEISCKFKICLSRDEVTDAEVTAYHAMREVIIPKIEHKIKSLIKVQDGRSGYVGGAKYELVWSKEAGEYVMREIDDGNPSLFDYIDDDDSKPTTEVPAETCESALDGSCAIMTACGKCCRNCEDPADCIQICERYAHLAAGTDMEIAPGLDEAVEIGTVDPEESK